MIVDRAGNYLESLTQGRPLGLGRGERGVKLTATGVYRLYGFVEACLQVY